MGGVLMALAGVVGIRTSRNVGVSIWNTVPKATPQGTWVSGFQTTTFENGIVYNSTAAQNDAIEFDADLESGTYSLAVAALGWSGGAIATISYSLDGGVTYTTIGTMDTYFGSGNVGIRSVFAGIAVATPTAVRIRFTAATRNASNTLGYYLELTRMDWTRTA